MPDLFNPDPYSMAASEPYRPWSPYPDWLGGLPQMALNLGANIWAGQHGAPNFGVGFQGNLYNNQQQQIWLTRHNMAIQSLAMDSPGASNTMVEFMRGQYQKHTGKQWSPDMESAGQNLATWMSGVGAPMMLQSEAGTGMYDRILGGRRPEVLGKYMSMAGRHMDDPAFPSERFSVQSTVRASQMLFEDLYGGDPSQLSGTNRWKRTAGLTTHETGQLLQEMTMRGQISPSYDRGLEDEPGGEGVEAKTRRAVDKMKSALDTRFKAVEALKEIFGAAGQTNAPIQKLLDSLEAFTGGTQQISLKDNPFRLETIVRGLNNASQEAGISMHGTSILMGITSQNLRAGGINQAFTPQVVEDSLLYRTALQRSGAMSTPAWGLLNVDESSALRRQLSQGAIGSEFGNFLGAAARLESQGLLDASTPEGARMRQLLNDARNKTLSSEQIREIMEGGQSGMLGALQDSFGLSAGMAQSALGSRHANAEHIYKNKLQNAITGPAQMADFGRLLGFTGGGVVSNLVSSELTTAGAARGVRTDSAGALSVAMSKAVWDRYQRMGMEDANDPARRNALLAGALEDTLRAEGGELGAAMLAGPDRAKRLRALAEQMINEADQQGQSLGAPALVNLRNNNSPEVRAQQARANARKNINTFLQSLHSGETKDDPILRTVDALINAGYDPAKNNLDAIMKGLGIEDAASRAALAKTNIAGIAKARMAANDRAEGLVGTVGDELTEEQKKRLTAEQQTLSGALNREISHTRADQGAYEKIMQELEKQERLAHGAQEAEITLNVENLEINGTQIQKASGKSKGEAKGGDGRGGMPVGGKK